MAAGSGFSSASGPQFNQSDTPHYELLRRQLVLDGLPRDAWLGGWPSQHTVHDALMSPALVVDWLRTMGSAQVGDQWAAGCRVCAIDLVSDAYITPLRC